MIKHYVQVIKISIYLAGERKHGITVNSAEKVKNIDFSKLFPHFPFVT